LRVGFGHETALPIRTVLDACGVPWRPFRLPQLALARPSLSETRRLFSSGEIKLPPGVTYEFSGQTKDFQDLLSKAILAALLSIIAMYLVLASLYDSFFVPLSIMLVLPLAICGAFYALWVTHSVLDIYSMVGCILLLGVAAKNSILLVDYVQTGRREGLALAAALRRAGKRPWRLP
jgi:hydrophobic/amphiphilic exporter-1 (mainly G- bacteria), HAE1 family